MLLQIQNPLNVSSPSLHEALISACTGATYGGGAFAFVTSGGVNLYLGDEAFENFISEGSFDLVVGIDEITNLNALRTLQTQITNAANLNVHVFAHDLTQSTFHPKFCWFKKNSGGILVIGSGNLTVKGLRKNWEGFSVLQLSEDEINQVEETWNQWKASCGDILKPLDDDDVRLRAEQNIIRRRISTIIGTESQEEEIEVGAEAELSPQQQEEDEHIEDISPWNIQETNTVLIAEIPAGGSRWNQANFNQQSFEDFFGGTIWDNSYRILLREVNDDGDLLEIENRQAVSVQSSNWRFELGAASGLSYPDNGRPTGVFVRVGIRMFLYILIMPDSAFYEEITALLDNRWNGPINRMRRITLPISQLRQSCPNLSFWSIEE